MWWYIRMGTRTSRCTPSGVGAGLSVADRAGAGQDPVEASVAVSGSVHDTGLSVAVGERIEDTVGASASGKDVDERINGEEGDDRRIGARVGGNVDGRKEALSKCPRDLSRPVIWRPRLRADWAVVDAPCSSVLSEAQWV